MKTFQLIPLALLLVLLLGCNKKALDNSLQEEINNPLTGYIENQDSIFPIVLDKIYQYMESKEIEIPDDAKTRYEQLERLTHELYDYKPNQTNADIQNNLSTELNQLRFLNYYLMEELKVEMDNSSYLLLTEEVNQLDSVINTQQDFLRTHIDDAYNDGSSSYMKYYNLENKYLTSINESLQDLNIILEGIIEYKPVEYKDIWIGHINEAFYMMSKFHIPTKTADGTKLDTYDAEKDRRTSINAFRQWKKLLEVHEAVSLSLPQKVKTVWENAKNRLNRTYLIILKNQYEGLGMTNGDMNKVLLADTCSYDELISYPGFNEKWEIYLDSFNKN